MSAVTTIATVVALLAALVHVYIFLMESILWTRPATWRRFGVASQQDAETVRPMAYNQGFYNLFLGIGVAIGALLLAATPYDGIGMAILGFGLLCMLLASIVLVTSQPALARAAAVQGAFPLIALVLYVIGALAG